MIRQDCNSLEIQILKGVVGKDHVHLHIEYPPKLGISVILKQLKGRSSRLPQKEFPPIKRRYWGQRFWAKGYRAFSARNNTDEMVQKYIEGHREKPNENNDDFILE